MGTGRSVEVSFREERAEFQVSNQELCISQDGFEQTMSPSAKPSSYLKTGMSPTDYGDNPPVADAT